MAVDNRGPVRMELLDYIAANAQDEDYAFVAQRRAMSDPPAGGRPKLATTLTVLVFGLLVAVSAVHTSRNAMVSDVTHRELADQISQRSTELDARRARVVTVRAEVAALQRQDNAMTQRARAAQDRVDRLAAGAGAEALRGPGVVITVADAANANRPEQRVLDMDLQSLVNGLWDAGAEAIAINSHRLTTLTAIRAAGSAITVGGRSLRQPYVVSAIGDPDSVPARFVETQGGSTWLDLQSTYGLQFDLTTKSSLTLPDARKQSLRFAEPRTAVRQGATPTTSRGSSRQEATQ